MPSSITHYLFITKTLEIEDDPILALGSQGPDPFFYYGYNHSRRKDIPQIRNFGTFLHHIDPYLFFEHLFDYVANQRDNHSKEVLTSFVKGLLAHYVLDRNVHPYVFYVTGVYSTENSESQNKKVTLRHQTLEANIDTMLMHHFGIDKINYQKMLLPIKKGKGKEPTSSKSNKVETTCYIDLKDLKLISEMMYSLSVDLNYYGLNPLSYYDSVISMVFSCKVINSSVFGFRKWVFSTLMKDSVINSMSHASYKKLKNVKDKYNKDNDYLNLEHKDYFSTTNKGELIGNSSILDLMDKSKIELLDLFTKLDKMLSLMSNDISCSIYKKDSSALKQEINSYFDRIDHDGVKETEEMKHYCIRFEL